jgi:KipI family sensor histidine kinase inhibitor
VIHPPVVLPLGDAALLARMDASVTDIRRYAARVSAAHIHGVTDVTPAYTSFAVFFDPRLTTYAMVAQGLVSVPHAQTNVPVPVRHHRIPVRYDGTDLAEVARRTGLSGSDVIRRHAAPTYTVYCLGFVPGFGYLGDLDPALALPRRAEPRRRVPAGSVAIAGSQTAVYPLETPGGWHLIGRTDMTMFDATNDPPARLAAGDTVQFVPEDA